MLGCDHHAVLGPGRLCLQGAGDHGALLTETRRMHGPVRDFLRERGDLDNTIVMVISDNGASAEGGPTGTTNEAQFFNNAQEPLEDSLKVIDEIGGPDHFNHSPWGWTWAGNTPFRRWKRETYRGGASDPFIVSWPQGIKRQGEIRTQYAHIIDMVPTAANAGFYAEIVVERATLRRLVEAGTRIVQLGYASDGGEVEEAINEAQAQVYAVTERGQSEDFLPLGEVIDETLNTIEATQNRGGQVTGVPTGFAELDDLTATDRPWQTLTFLALGVTQLAVEELCDHGTVLEQERQFQDAELRLERERRRAQRDLRLAACAEEVHRVLGRQSQLVRLRL